MNLSANYILNLETTTKNCSVSISANGKCLSIKEIANENYVHAEYLHLFIAEVLRECQLNFSDLQAIAVSKGPGSYTGLRIGVSAAKGLCYALDLPLIAVDTMQVLARQVEQPEGNIVTVLDARRMEVYFAAFDKNFASLQSTCAIVVDENSFNPFLSNSATVFVGDAVNKIKPFLQDNNVVVKDNSFPSAKEMSNLAFEKFQKKEFENLAYFEPFYLKDFIVVAKKV